MNKGVSFEDVIIGDEAFSDGKVSLTVSAIGNIPGHTIHLIDNDNRQKTLSVHPLLGTVRIKKGHIGNISYIEEDAE